MRTLGMRANGRAHRRHASIATRIARAWRLIAAGVNAYVDAQPVLPVEFQVFRMKPERWKPADTVGWLLVMAWDLSANWRTELARLRFAVKLGPERANEIIPPYPGDAPIPFLDFKALLRRARAGRRCVAGRFPQTRTTRTDRTAGWSPARAARPASLSSRTTRTWIAGAVALVFAHVSSPSMNVVGGTLPGVPFIVLGHNDYVAWSLTTTLGDTQDLICRARGAGRSVELPHAHRQAKFETRDEAIRVGWRISASRCARRATAR